MAHDYFRRGQLGLVSPDSESAGYDCAIKMVEWKDEQFAKIAKRVYADLLSAQGYDVATINSECERLEAELKTASCSKKSNN